MIPAALIFQTPQAALSPKDFTARCGELSKAKDWPGLEALARTQIAADSKDAAAQAALGFALLAQNKTDEGKAACERAITLDPKQANAYVYLGLAYAQSKDREGVIKTGQRLSAALPFAVENYYKVPALAAASGADPDELFGKDAILMPAHGWPAFPDTARARGIQGTVVIELHVAPDGVPSAATVLAGHPLLATPSILDYAKRSRFKPVMKDGHPVSFRFLFFYDFKIEGLSRPS